MNAFTRSITQIFKGAYSALQTFPASILSALGFSIVTMIRIQLDWPEQEAFNFLFNCLHWSLALGAVFGLAALTAAKSRSNSPTLFKLANLLTLAVVGFALAALYYWGGADTAAYASRYEALSSLAVSRVSAGMLASLLAFILLAAKTSDPGDVSRSLFMTQKAFFIAAIYGFVIMAGTSSVAGAIQNLLYHGMSEKVYMYIATIAGFLAFTIFAGYFPDLSKDAADSRREVVQKQPQFVEILFGYIMIPIVMALTLVLFLWAGRTLITGSWPVFIELSAIATTYALSGIWLHMMVTQHDSAIAMFYKRFYPIAALVILAFEAQALVIQLGKAGLKTTEYFFILLWIVAAASAILLIVRKVKAHSVILLLVCSATVFSVLPFVGYHILPVKAQITRLEGLLVAQGMLSGNQVTPAANGPDQSVREAITDAVSFLASAENTQLPAWFDKRMNESEVFKEKMGFEQTWPKDPYPADGSRYLGLSLMLPSEAIDISGYEYALALGDQYKQDRTTVNLNTPKGNYQVQWIVAPPTGIPRLKILLDDKVLLEQDMNAYLDALMARHPLSEKQSDTATLDDMRVVFSNQSIEVLVVFRNININIDPQSDLINYWLDPYVIYLHEKE